MIKPFSGALKVTAIYIIVGSLWILFSDQVVALLTSDTNTITRLSIFKGWIFVVLTGGMLYRLISSLLAQIAKTHKVIETKNEELTAINEELAASEEELRQQFCEVLTSQNEIRRQNIVLTSLHETALGLMNRLNLDDLLRAIVAGSAELIGSPNGFVSLVDEEQGVFVRQIGTGYFEHSYGKTYPLSHGLAGMVLKTGKTQVLDDFRTWEHRVQSSFHDQLRAAVGVPLVVEGKVIGVLGSVFLDPDRKFADHEIYLLNRFAELASLALDNAQLVASYKNEIQERAQTEAALRTSEANFQAIFNAAFDGIFLHEAETGVIVDVNDKLCELYGRTKEEMLSRTPAEFGTGDSPYTHAEALQRVKLAAAGEPQLFEWKATHKDGRQLWVEVNLKLATVGGEDRVLAAVRDISQRKKTEIELRRSQASNQALINAIPDPLFVLTRTGIFIDYKGSAEQLYLQPHKFLGRSVSKVMPAEVAAKTLQAIEITLDTGDIQVFEYQLSILGKKEYYEARIVVSGPDEVLAIIRNITERKTMEEQLEQLSLHDALTGLYNRAFFEEEMKLLEEVRNSPAGLIICDVDGLKIVNDSLGHNTGDAVLKAVAAILKKSFRAGDLVARIGGDEFAVLRPVNAANIYEADCRRIRENIERYNTENPTVPISLSMGFAVSKETQPDMNALFKEADNNMYREKLHRQKSARSAIVKALIQALEARDYITEGHGERLQNLIESFAHALSLPNRRIGDLRLLARFHDIGKVGIPDSILFKPGRLTEEEMAIMRQHCEIGYRIAKSAPDLAPIAEWILKHQEWWNGKGYPGGLAGQGIPFECRMLGIVDAFDAMTNDRPYRRALSKADAIAELRRCKGTQFDPDLVEPFIALLDN